MYTTDRARQTQQTLLRKHELPGTNFPADHDRRHISTSGTAKKAASSLRLKSMGNSGNSKGCNATRLTRIYI